MGKWALSLACLAQVFLVGIPLLNISAESAERPFRWLYAPISGVSIVVWAIILCLTTQDGHHLADAALVLVMAVWIQFGADRWVSDGFRIEQLAKFFLSIITIISFLICWLVYWKSGAHFTEKHFT